MKDEKKPSETPETEKGEKPQGEKVREPLKIRELLLLTLANLEGKAWAYLGAITHVETGEMKKDLKEAKLAIDAYAALYELIKNEIGDEEKKQLELVLTNLRLNFVKEKE